MPGAFAAERPSPPPSVVTLTATDATALAASTVPTAVAADPPSPPPPSRPRRGGGRGHDLAAAAVVPPPSPPPSPRSFPPLRRQALLCPDKIRDHGVNCPGLATTSGYLSTLSRAEWDPLTSAIERMGTKAPAFHPWAREAVARLV